MLTSCCLCPRNCLNNRNNSETGFCKASDKLQIGKVMLHKWEEPFISGKNGSGTIFFSHCNLKCVYCQNHEISQGNIGKEIGIERLAEIMIEQQAKGAHNINLVTPTQYVPQIIHSIKSAKQKGLAIPIIYNTNAYENPSTIKALEGLIDVYLPDLKYFNNSYAVQYSSAPNYFKYASNAIEKMFLQVGSLDFDREGMIKKGVVIRHLVLPGLLSDSKKVLDYIASRYGNSVYVCLMNQYTPIFKAFQYPEISKVLELTDYDILIEHCLSIGLDNVLIQETGTASKEFIPDFNLKDI